MENTTNGDHRIDMTDLSPKNQHRNDDAQKYLHTNGNSEKSNLMSSSVDSVHDKSSSVNATSLDVRHLPTSRRSEAYNTNPRNGAVLESDVDPLLDTEMIPKPHPPIAHPELDDDDEPDTNNIPNTPQDHPGVDDGFFPVDIGPRVGDDKPKSGHPPNGNVPSGRRPSVNNNFPYAPGYAPGYDGFDPLAGNPQIIPDVNVYQHKKTLAQGMMDLALLSANANQLRYVLESYNRHPYYYFSLVFISLSLILQIAVGVGLIMNSRYDVKRDDHICKADKINNFTILGIFLITIVNVFISSFGVADPPPEMNG
ncbi:hypothetical protein HA402_002888 [Bradysia odoriphaga]|nr:hypothetical protein HA402_002888 [Bradysia odoriphaga]